MDSLEITPSSNAYTPSMAKLKKWLEATLANCNDDNLSDAVFRDAFRNDIIEVRGLMATLLMQDILYKAGVSYEDLTRGYK